MQTSCKHLACCIHIRDTAQHLSQTPFVLLPRGDSNNTTAIDTGQLLEIYSLRMSGSVRLSVSLAPGFVYLGYVIMSRFSFYELT